MTAFDDNKARWRNLWRLTQFYWCFYEVLFWIYCANKEIQVQNRCLLTIFKRKLELCFFFLFVFFCWKGPIILRVDQKWPWTKDLDGILKLFVPFTSLATWTHPYSPFIPSISYNFHRFLGNYTHKLFHLHWPHFHSVPSHFFHYNFSIFLPKFNWKHQS